MPQVLVLNDCGIDQAGAPEDLKKKCNSVKELDLAQNKLENWNEVRRRSTCCYVHKKYSRLPSDNDPIHEAFIFSSIKIDVNMKIN